MKIITINGSSNPNGSNAALLQALPAFFSDIIFQYCPLHQLPLFLAEKDKAPWSAEVLQFRQVIAEANAVIISTPEYLHNIPAILKNALEWLTTSGELQNKPVLAITFTPYPPRGEKAMQSLLWSLKALEARIVGQLPLYQNEMVLKNGQLEIKEDGLLTVLNSSISELAVR